ncbi:MAG: DNA-protecting protein DprA [Treponema sp.]|nr:DNA-protecting protein DprA [Treponema sp.]
MENTILAIALSAVDFLNAFEKTLLLQELKALERGGANPLDFFKAASYDQIAELSKRDKERPLRVRRWNPQELVRLAKKSAMEAKVLGVNYVLLGCDLYPPLLKEIPDPPFALFYRGNIRALCSKTVSVVGTRRLSPEGRKAAKEFSYEAAAAGYCVVSGLALGADGCAHMGAVDAFFDGRAGTVNTAAVLACGVDNVFPPSHKKLAGQIIQNGGVVLSEWAPGVPGEKWRFVSRNRIIAGLSPATLVVQAPPGSGALLTADFALGYNREVCFHEACFCKNALVLSGLVHKNLEAQSGTAAARKIETRPEVYVADGARVVSSFEDFSRNF